MRERGGRGGRRAGGGDEGGTVQQRVWREEIGSHQFGKTVRVDEEQLEQSRLPNAGTAEKGTAKRGGEDQLADDHLLEREPELSPRAELQQRGQNAVDEQVRVLFILDGRGECVEELLNLGPVKVIHRCRQVRWRATCLWARDACGATGQRRIEEKSGSGWGGRRKSLTTSVECGMYLLVVRGGTPVGQDESGTAFCKVGVEAVPDAASGEQDEAGM